MNLGGWGLLAGVVFGAIGVGYLTYGRRAARVAWIVAGLILMVFPWFVTRLAILIGIGLALIVLPFIAAGWFKI